MQTDINECVLDMDNDCDENAECNNTVGGFNCTCYPGYMGNGTMCTGIYIVISASIVSASSLKSRIPQESIMYLKIEISKKLC